MMSIFSCPTILPRKFELIVAEMALSRGTDIDIPQRDLIVVDVLARFHS